MLDEQQYQCWCRSLGFKRETKELLDRIRSSPPARRVGGGKKRVAGRYPSRKMGVTIQFESHSNELAAVLEYENDPDCLEFYDQPQPCIPLEYRAKKGRQLPVLHTADFFVLRAESAGWVECKTEQDLVNLAEQSPERFQKAVDGTWHCRPGEDYASRFALCYYLRSSRETDLVYRRNLEFLEDYRRCATLMIAEAARTAVLAAVRARPGITVAELMQVTNPFGPDDIYGLIAAADLYVDLHAAPLTDAARVPVFCSMEEAQTHSMVTKPDRGPRRTTNQRGRQMTDPEVFRILQSALNENPPPSAGSTPTDSQADQQRIGFMPITVHSCKGIVPALR
ncbi:MAG TPA: hypothetical protein VGM27_33740 [Acidobacteriaceae bacterium]